MNDKLTGGPAFPFGQTDFETGALCNGWGSEGMTLRDYFAAKAMQAIIAGSIPSGVLAEEGAENTVCKAAYKAADAMLEARK